MGKKTALALVLGCVMSTVSATDEDPATARFDFAALLDSSSRGYVTALAEDLRASDGRRVHYPAHTEACEQGAALAELVAKARCLGLPADSIRGLMSAEFPDETVHSVFDNTVDAMLGDIFRLYSSYQPQRIRDLWRNRCRTTPTTH